MAQIKQDMKGSKRLFSGDTEVSHVTRVESDLPLSNKENEPHPARLRRGTNLRMVDELATEFGNMTIEVWQAKVHVNVEPAVSKAPHVAVIPPTPISAAQNNQHLLVPPNGPTYPSFSIRGGNNEDLNRFVSSSTATGTTLTAGSAESFVKHAGPKQMTRIGPEDVAGALSDRVGKMVLDRETMRWVRDTALATTGVGGQAANADDAEREADAESEDPFRDIESLRDDDSRALEEEEEQEGRLAVIEEAEVEDAEEVALNSFSFDESSAAVVQVMTGVEEDDEEEQGYSNAVVDDTTDSDDSSDDESEHNQNHQQGMQDFSLDQFPPLPHVGAMFSTPLPTRSTAGPPGSTPYPSVRSVLKSNSQTPVSALKDPNRNKTPAHSGHHRRSVSFSDGKRDGPIRGLTRNAGEDGVLEADCEDPGYVKSGTGSLSIPSARSKRIADMLDGFDDQSEVSATMGCYNSDRC
jgi:protein NUD1